MENKLPKLKQRKVVDKTGEVVAQSVVGSGNVFADLGFEDAEELQLKAGLIHEIRQTITRRNLTQHEAARLAGIDQPALSKLLSGKGLKCSVEKLFAIHNRLGNKVEVRIHEDADARMLLVA